MNGQITGIHNGINYVIDYALHECVQCNHDGKPIEPKRMYNTIYWTLTMDHKDGATMTTGLTHIQIKLLLCYYLLYSKEIVVVVVWKCG